MHHVAISLIFAAALVGFFCPELIHALAHLVLP